MGVKTNITLQSVRKLFPTYNFIEIIPTKYGIMDTTYIIKTKDKSYILKKYERDIESKILKDIKLLKLLKKVSLNVSTCIEKKDSWYIYTKLSGTQPKHITSIHIQQLAKFLSKMHNITHNKYMNCRFITKQEIKKMLKHLKSKNYMLYKKYTNIDDSIYDCDGIIHGDIFKDNTVFDAHKIGVFDFSDSGDGSFAFDVGVSLFGFDIKSKFYRNLFLITYNQNAKQKLSKNDLDRYYKTAFNFYSIKRALREVT